MWKREIYREISSPPPPAAAAACCGPVVARRGAAECHIARLRGSSVAGRAQPVRSACRYIQCRHRVDIYKYLDIYISQHIDTQWWTLRGNLPVDSRQLRIAAQCCSSRKKVSIPKWRKVSVLTQKTIWWVAVTNSAADDPPVSQSAFTNTAPTRAFSVIVQLHRLIVCSTSQKWYLYLLSIGLVSYSYYFTWRKTQIFYLILLLTFRSTVQYTLWMILHLKLIDAWE